MLHAEFTAQSGRFIHAPGCMPFVCYMACVWAEACQLKFEQLCQEACLGG